MALAPIRCRSYGAAGPAVAALHGADDPHPGRMIRASLAPHVRRLEYREFASGGHEPWVERGARDEFFLALRDWRRRQAR